MLNIHADVWVLDNDGTLYNCPRKLEEAVTTKMIEFIAQQRAISIEQATTIREQLLREFSTKLTTVALALEGKTDIDRFVEETYLAVPLDDFGLRPSAPLLDWLSGESGKKIVHTNAPAAFARRVLRFLHQDDSADEIIGIQEAGFIEKPKKGSLAFLEPWLKAGLHIVVIDDKRENVDAAIAHGCTGVVWSSTTNEAELVS